MELRRAVEKEFPVVIPLGAFAAIIIIRTTLSVVASEGLELTDRFEPRRYSR
jgi:hypothetical protein